MEYFIQAFIALRLKDHMDVIIHNDKGKQQIALFILEPDDISNQFALGFSQIRLPTLKIPSYKID